MGPEVAVVDEVLEQLVGEVGEVVEGCAVDDVVVQGAPAGLEWLAQAGKSLIEVKA